MVERIDRSRIAAASEKDVDAFIESDFKIRSGMCPNGHGLMNPTDYGQQCATCGFFCNTHAERETPN